MSYRSCLALIASVSLSGAAYAAGANNTLFLHHLDAMNGTPGGDADYANGNAAQLVGSPDGPGGTIVGGGQFGNALDRTTGGRLKYGLANNFNILQGTMEAWIKLPGITGQPWNNTGNTMDAIWGTDTSSGGGDLRMYLYSGGTKLGGYFDQVGTFWETEYTIPSALRTANEWHHVAWEWNIPANRAEIFFDGQKISSGPDYAPGGVNANPAALTATRMHLGEAQTGSAPFAGQIDEFRISDVVRYSMDGNFTPPQAAFVVPEPGTISLIALAGGALVSRRRRD